MIQPGATIGLLGGGQLARMTALAARPLGYRLHLFDPHPEPPAGVVCERVFRAPLRGIEARKTAERPCLFQPAIGCAVAIARPIFEGLDSGRSSLHSPYTVA